MFFGIFWVWEKMRDETAIICGLRFQFPRFQLRFAPTPEDPSERGLDIDNGSAPPDFDMQNEVN